MCLWCISAIGGGWWIMYPSPSSLAHSLTERGGQKVRNFRAFQSPSNIINPPRMQKWNLATSDLESYRILDVLVKYHKSRVLLIKWSQFLGGSAVNLLKNKFALQSQLTRKVPVHRWGSRLKTWYVRRRSQRCRFWLISSLINSKATWWIGFFSCPCYNHSLAKVWRRHVVSTTIVVR